MLNLSPTIIRDYLARLEPITDHPRRSMGTSQRPNAAGDPFTRLLTSSLTDAQNSAITRARGLTAEDYLSQPMPAPRSSPWAAGRQPPLPASLRSGSSIANEASSRQPASASADFPAPLQSKESSTIPVTTAATIERCIREASEKYDVSPDLVRAVVKAESNFKVDAVSGAGAQGLMQLMPATARELGVDDPFDIRQNIDGGTCYLRQMLDLFGGDIRKALSAYNAGPGNVRKYNGDVPFPETRQYVSRVLKSIGRIA